jgi:NTP pyrophosphatase (non-canonical NTP hydrolase)
MTVRDSLYLTAADLSATAADIAADLAEGRSCPGNLTHARRLLDTLAANLGDGAEAFSLARFAATVTVHLGKHFDPATLPVQQVLALAEEAGEFTAAYRRWAGMARRPGGWDDVCAELADVVITAHVTARVLGIDLDAAWRAKAAVVLSRGWREEPPGGTSKSPAAPAEDTR